MEGEGVRFGLLYLLVKCDILYVYIIVYLNAYNGQEIVAIKSD